MGKVRPAEPDEPLFGIDIRLTNRYVEHHTANDHRELAELVEIMIGALPDEAARVRTRLLLKRWLNHPEGGRQGSALVVYAPPPPSPGRNRITPGICVVCGFTRASHDIDGQRDDCDGYAGLM